ncbi:MAG: L,D-transpeptidase [Verrucomicrobia bacterium]|nr:L,D-transpeptidase [Verrucomicrobiota bacterium]
MRSSVPIYTRYRRGRSRSQGPSPTGWLWALLCLGLAALLGWVCWRHTNVEGRPGSGGALATNLASRASRSVPPSPASPATPSPPPPAPNAAPSPDQRMAPSPALGPSGMSQITSNPAPSLTPDLVREKPINRLPIEPPGSVRPVRDVFEAQLAMIREGISAGSLDGALGSQTRAALSAFQRKHKLVPTGLLDADTKARMLVSLPLHTNYTVTSNDLARLLPLPHTWLEKSEQPRLDYETILELVAEKAFSHPALVRRLNPDLPWDTLAAGTEVTLPQAEYPLPATKAAWVDISLADKVLEAFDSSSNLLAHFPCSIGRLAEKRPVGELHVAVVALHPNYTFNPEVFPESEEARQLGRKLILPPGPNNPVGAVWIGLDRPGYGIHGTPSPELVGRTESHGCFRLANWNAEYLAKLVVVGTLVVVEP